MPSDKSTKDRCEKVLSKLVSVFTVLAIVGGLYGYFSAQHDKRVQKTFEFYKAFHSDPLRKNWILLISRWNDVSEKADALLEQQNFDGLYKLILSLVSDEDGRQAAGNIIDFFDEFDSCVEHGLCDNNSGVAMLKNSAKEFIGPYGAYIYFLRKKYNDKTTGAGAYKVQSMTPRFNVFDLAFLPI